MLNKIKQLIMVAFLGGAALAAPSGLFASRFSSDILGGTSTSCIGVVGQSCFNDSGMGISASTLYISSYTGSCGSPFRVRVFSVSLTGAQ